VLTGLASVLEAQGAWVQAVQLLGAAEVTLDAIGETRNTLERDDYEQTLARSHTQLSAATFAEAWAQGQAMTLEALLAQHGDTLAFARGMDQNGWSRPS